MAAILVADDDLFIRELIAIYLKKEGYTVFEANDGVEATNILSQRTIHLCIIDVMMPNKNGWELCKEIRELYDLPILMVTAKGESEDKVKGFQQGTDDYIVKPFDTHELIMRVKALLRRYKINTTNKVTIGNVVIDANSMEVTINHEPIMFPLKEFHLLFKLASHPGQVFSRDQLIEEIWGSDFEGFDRTVDSHIKKIRKKLNQQIAFDIVTIRGLGYRLEVIKDV
ncbi:response regulator transcription factor [Sutcliffiella horikoshii]|uniref:Heme response regulator HssR n=1 Tax=Sutcliffiella horikoshii TaxID=79883 RepID=A0AA94WLP4_9BACI|nr:response regulator transcription factor [Sutcliffiella horikoshii]TYS58082.1 response regulator transcription factor [Sutcliffiella horikoshii]